MYYLKKNLPGLAHYEVSGVAIMVENEFKKGYVIYSLVGHDMDKYSS